MQTVADNLAVQLEEERREAAAAAQAHEQAAQDASIVAGKLAQMEGAVGGGSAREGAVVSKRVWEDVLVPGAVCGCAHCETTGQGACRRGHAPRSQQQGRVQNSIYAFKYLDPGCQITPRLCICDNNRHSAADKCWGGNTGEKSTIGMRFKDVQMGHELGAIEGWVNFVLMEFELDAVQGCANGS